MSGALRGVQGILRIFGALQEVPGAFQRVQGSFKEYMEVSEALLVVQRVGCMMFF